MTAPVTAYPPPPGRRLQINLGISNEMILYVAAECRNYHSVPHFVAGEEPIPYIGRQFAFWPVEFPDGFRVLVKVPLLILTMEDNNYLVHMMKVEWNILSVLQKRGFQWAPRPLYLTTASNNPLGKPYFIHTMPPGKRLEWSDTFPAEKANREKVLGQIARINFDLSMVDPKIIYTITPLQFLTDIVDRRMLRVLQGLDREYGIDARACVYLRILVRKIAEGKTTSRNFVLSHENLFDHNIFIDKNFNVTGFIEWGCYKFMPLRFALRFPWFLNIRNKQQRLDMPSDPLEFSKEFLNVPLLMKADREFYISRMQYEFAKRGSRYSIGHLSPKGWEMMCWDLDHVDWNHMIFDAVHNRHPHAILATHQFLVGGLPECPSGKLQDMIHWKVLYKEVWDFFCQHSHEVNLGARGNITPILLHRAVFGGMPWPFVEMMLIDAFGKPRV